MSKNYRIPGIDFIAKPVSLSRDPEPSNRLLYARAKSLVEVLLMKPLKFAAFLLAPWLIAFLGCFLVALILEGSSVSQGATPWYSMSVFLLGGVIQALDWFLLPGLILMVIFVVGRLTR